MMSLMIMPFVIFILGILFLAIVAPVWIVLHYTTRLRTSRRLSGDDERALVELGQAAQRMENRIAALEQILDAETPGWRQRSGA